MTVRLAAALVALVFAVLAAPAAGAETILGSEPVRVSVSAHGGLVAWSSFDPATRTYGLRTSAGGVVSNPWVRRRGVPFDVDVGPDASGAPVLAYSRCRREEGVSVVTGLPQWRRAVGCDLYRYSPATGTEQRLRVSSRTASETLPSIWGRRIAFAWMAERPGRRRGEVPRLHTSTLAGRGARVFRGGATGRLVRFDRGEPAIDGPSATSLDLRGDELTFAWEYLGDQCSPPDPDGEDPLDPPPSSQIIRITPRIRTLLDSGCDYRWRFGASFGAGGPIWLRRTDAGMELARPRGAAPLPFGGLSAAEDGDTLIVVRLRDDRYEIVASSP